MQAIVSMKSVESLHQTVMNERIGLADQKDQGRKSLDLVAAAG